AVVVAGDLGDGVPVRQGASAFRIAAGDRDQLAVARSRDRRQHRTPGDPGRAEDAPAQPVGRYMSTSSLAPPCAIEAVAASITATVRRASCGVTASGSSHARWSATLR